MAATTGATTSTTSRNGTWKLRLVSRALPVSAATYAPMPKKAT